MAKSGHTLHPVICRNDTHELWVVVVACGGHGEAFRENEHSCRGWKCNHPYGFIAKHMDMRLYFYFSFTVYLLSFIYTRTAQGLLFIKYIEGEAVSSASTRVHSRPASRSPLFTLARDDISFYIVD